MCGIAGVIGAELPDEALAIRARDTLSHRGPDDAGCFRTDGAWLAHRRLAIIDVGDPGHQPFADEETGTTIVFNGEIFNYIELRAELETHGHRFRSHTDTEVLLRAYLQWGSACVERFNGMWAFAIWDPRTRQGFLSRDRFGIKPLFIAAVPGGLAFASEPKALLALYPRLRRPDEVAIARLLAEKRIYADGRSFYDSISVFPAAHWGSIRPGDTAPAMRRYWEFPEPEASGSSTWLDVERDFEELFDDSVRLRLRSDVPLGVTLSGGLDSTAILHATRQGLEPRTRVRAYTAIYSSSSREAGLVDEREWARLAASRYERTELREIVASDQDLLDVLRRIVWHMDGPGFSPAVFPVWRIMESVHGEQVKVLLEGQGADELLGGYSAHVAAALRDSVARAIRERSAAAGTEAVRTVRGVPGAFSVRRVLGDLAGEVSEPARRWDVRRSTVVDALRPELIPPPPPEPSAVDGRGYLGERLLRDFARDLLPGFLHYGDAISMAHSIESRLPFLDHRLVELCFRMPGEYKLRAGRSKAVLRSYVQRAGHREIAVCRRKRGYPTPTSQWLARDGGSLLRQLLLDRDAFTRAYLAPDALERLIDRHAGGMLAAGDVLFGLVSTELWLQECVHPDRARSA